jgi:hypothetical protein
MNTRLILGVIIMIALGTTTAIASMLATQSSYAAMRVDSGLPARHVTQVKMCT